MSKLFKNIFQGDTLHVLKDLPTDSVDMGVTSPPYNKQENKKGWLVQNVRYNGVSDKKDEESYQANQIAVLNELFRVIKLGGSFFYNHKTRWERGKMIHPLEWVQKSKWTIRQEIIWDRMIAANIRGWRFWQKDERIYWLYKPVGNNFIGTELLAKHALLSSIWRFSPERENPHPAPFPLVLPIRCIHSILDERNGIVIDPYAGSGTTLVAAALLGKSYIGIDISKEYIEQTKRRIKNMEQEREVLAKELQKHIVLKTFKERKRKGEFVGRFRDIDIPLTFTEPLFSSLK